MTNLYNLNFLALLFLLFVGCMQETDKMNSLPFSVEAGLNEKTARGKVFHDKNNNRIFDSGERGIAGVAVSNGEDVVQTNANGEYALPVDNDAIIFVIKPKNWMTPLDENNLPRFYYLHKPKGSPYKLEYPGVAPTGSLPDSINFPLYPASGSNAFKMVVFGDPQPYNIEEVDFLAEDIISELIGGDDLTFGMTMGDIVGDDLALFSPLNQAVSNIGIPWYNVLGNHDINFDVPTDTLSDETYERVFGPPTYAFQYGDVHFIVVDDVIYHGADSSRKYVGGLRPDQLTFVENYLKTVPKENLVVLTMHIPLAKHGKTFRQSDQKRLFDLLKDFPNTLSISAHTHTHNHHFFHEGSSDWKQATPHHHFNVGTTSGSWWNGMRGETDVPHTMMRDGTPNGYSFISFNGTEYIIDWKVAGSAADHQMNIHVPRGIVANSTDTVLLTVNFFNGSEQSSVYYRVKGHTEWIEMKRVKKYDPYYLKIIDRWKNLKKLNIHEQWMADTSLADKPFPGTPMPRPEISSHIWEANIGSGWPAGSHVIEVKAHNRYGKTFTDFYIFRVAGK